jgi:UPF0755 protein
MLRFLRNLFYLAAFGGVLYFWAYLFLTQPLPYQQRLMYQVKNGATIDTIAKDFTDEYLFTHIWQTYTFIAYGYLSHKAYHLKAGEYQFDAGMSPLALLQKIVKGDVFLREITFPEGITYTAMLDDLKTNPYLKHDLLRYDDKALQQLLQIPSTNSLEGWFYPSTYKFARGSSDLKIVQLSHAKMQKRLDTLWQQRAANLPYQKPYDALIVASLVEREAKLKSEQPLIAGVILKRLSINMLLQIDASVIYGLGAAYTGKLTHDQVHNVDTPYNTYLHHGLPPSPIALVGQDALYAALHPVMTDNLFYVARGDGSHEFSATAAQQNQAVQKFLKGGQPVNVAPPAVVKPRGLPQMKKQNKK